MKDRESISVSYVEAALIVFLTWATALLVYLLSDNAALAMVLPVGEG